MTYSHRLRSVVITICCAVAFLCGLASCALAVTPPVQSLLKRYHEIEKQLAEHTSGLPIYIESSDKDHVLSGDVFSIISYPFSRISNVLNEPENWCDISLLHLNIKACTFNTANTIQTITIYSGRKFYQPPEDAYVLEYRFQVIEKQPNYLNILLTSDSGPLDTSDYRIELEAVPLQKGKTFIRFSYAYTYGLAAQTAMEAYFATLGRNKVGFTVIGTDEKNGPVYINGTRGAIERNAVRYYFAIQSYLDTLKIPQKNRFEKKIQLWYSLTDRFKQQLFELPRDDYISDKKLELQNQLKLQHLINRKEK